MDLTYSDEQTQFRDSVQRYTRDKYDFETRTARRAAGGFEGNSNPTRSHQSSCPHTRLLSYAAGGLV